MCENCEIVALNRSQSSTLNESPTASLTCMMWTSAASNVSWVMCFAHRQMSSCSSTPTTCTVSTRVSVDAEQIPLLGTVYWSRPQLPRCGILSTRQRPAAFPDSFAALFAARPCLIAFWSFSDRWLLLEPLRVDALSLISSLLCRKAICNEKERRLKSLSSLI